MPLIVRRIEQVTWRTESFKNLAVPGDTKQLIEALVKHKIDSELGLDPIRGKGTGLIILLHGFACPRLSWSTTADDSAVDLVLGKPSRLTGEDILRLMVEILS